jgi:hypothetical protein
MQFEIEVKPLGDLPVVVTGPGRYRTRGGLRVEVFEGRGTGTFPVRGCWFDAGKEKRSKSYPGEYSIWHPSGRYMPLAEHPLDIVGPWEG